MPKFRGRRSAGNQLLIEVFVSSDPFTHDVFQPESMQRNRFQALIDTGASASVISSKVVEKLSLLPKGKRTILSASDQVDVNAYQAYIAIPITEIRGESDKLSPIMQVHIKQFFLDITEMPKLANSFDILLGMDILDSCLLIVDGDQFILSF